MFNTLVCLFDEHNEVNILLVEKFKIKNLVLLVSEYDKDSKKIYSQMFPDCIVEIRKVENQDIESIKMILEKYKNVLVNLTGGEKLDSLILSRAASELNIDSIYVDLVNKKRYIFTNDFRIVSEPLKDISIKEITELSGVKIIDESSYLIEKSEILNITKIIQSNIEIWHKHKQKLYDNNTFIHNYRDSYRVIINRRNLEEEEVKLVDTSLKYLSDINGIEYFEENDQIVVDFKNNYLKGFLFKSGTWLEVLTHLIVKEIDQVDETKSGVIFCWSNNAKEVRNELDVIAIRDSVLVCISCKDSEKYDEDALNELKVYSDRLGGEDAIKILVATKKPSKVTVNNRAKEMGINLVIMGKDIEMFKKKIENIITEKKYPL
ncbi:DUF1887 family CARF protein [Clostridium sp. HBUAS56017]|nr:DUF1887 family CARF protein [Clostridium sp. HBUAS56017]